MRIRIDWRRLPRQHSRTFRRRPSIVRPGDARLVDFFPRRLPDVGDVRINPVTGCTLNEYALRRPRAQMQRVR